MTRVLVITTMRDEGPHLLEWVAHTRAAGGEILAFSNDCTDGTDRLLDLLAEAGALTHVRNAVPEGKTPQWAALKAAAAHPLTRSADWIAVLDCDEFVNLRAPLGSFQDLVAAVPGADAIVLPWRLFGHAGHLRRPDAPTIHAYDRAIRQDALYPALARFFKTLYRRAGPFRKPGVHRPRQIPGAGPDWRDGSGARLPDTFAARQDQILLWDHPFAADLVQLNHYSVRSVEDFMLKSLRGLPNRTAKAIDLTYWVERNFNEVEDVSIARMAPATLAELARLRAQPGVAEAEARARDRQRRRLDALLATPEGAQGFGRLALAAGSRSPGRAEALDLVRLYRQSLGGGTPA